MFFPPNSRSPREIKDNTFLPQKNKKINLSNKEFFFIDICLKIEIKKIYLDFIFLL